MEDNGQDCTTFLDSSSQSSEAYDDTKEVKTVGIIDCQDQVKQTNTGSWTYS